MEITGLQFSKAEAIYWSIIYSLPGDLLLIAPDFRKYLSPSSWSMFPATIYYGKVYELSITGKHKYDAIMGPHASTYVRAWLVKYYSATPNNDN